MLTQNPLKIGNRDPVFYIQPPPQPVFFCEIVPPPCSAFPSSSSPSGNGDGWLAASTSPMELRSSSGPPLHLSLLFSSVLPFPATLPPAPPLCLSSLYPVLRSRRSLRRRGLVLQLQSQVLLRTSRYHRRPSGGRALVWRGDAQLAGGWLKQPLQRPPSCAPPVSCRSVQVFQTLLTLLVLPRNFSTPACLNVIVLTMTNSF